MSDILLPANIYHTMLVCCFSNNGAMLVVLGTGLASFDVLVGQLAASDVTGLDAFTLCHHYSGSLPAAEYIAEIPCDDGSHQARYVAVIRRGTDVTLQFCELEVVATSGDIYF